MTEENNKAGLEDVCKEMGRDVIGFPKKLIRTTSEFASSAIVAGVAMAFVPYFIPTAANKTDECLSNACPFENQKLSLAEKTGIATGVIVGGVLDAAQICGYHHLAKKGHPEVLAIPVATNVISGLYEWYKSAKKRVESRGKGKWTGMLNII